MKSLDAIKARLENAERAYELAQYIDNTERMLKERAEFKSIVEMLKAKLDHREATLKEIL